jgi:methyltransferase family protein
VLVAPGSDASDPWEETESALSRALREDPALERALLGASPDDLAPADAFLRALVLEERGDHGAERAAAFERLYTPATLACMTALLDRIARLVAAASEEGSVVDVASGRGMLLERLQGQGVRPIATDISPRVLRAARARGLAAVACDAERLPFADRSVAIATTFLGLGNVRRPDAVLAEARRVANRLVAGHVVYERGTANDAAVEGLDLQRVAYRERLLEELAATGWDARVAFDCPAPAEPTPTGVLLAGVGIDALPVAPVDAAWLVIDAR